MEASPPNSLEKQIDSFLEHFRRSASRAMDAECTTTQVTLTTESNTTMTAVTSTSTDNEIVSALPASEVVDLNIDLYEPQQKNPLLDHKTLIDLYKNDTSGPIQPPFQQQATNTQIGAVLLPKFAINTSSINTDLSTSPTDVSSLDYPQAILDNTSLSNASEVNQRPTGRYISESINSILEHSSPHVAMSRESPLSITDVADLLHPQHAIITGGKTPDGCPLIIFPDNNNFQILEETDYQKLILYLTSIPSLQDVDRGFHLVIDRRRDKWASVKTVLQKISIYFPGIIHAVYVLRPSGLFQKAISEVSSKFYKDEYRFRLVICSALNDLHEVIDKSQLTADMGGALIYSHHEWIQQRISLEKFSTLTHQVSDELDVFIQIVQDTEFPNSVDATKKLLADQGSDYNRLKGEILGASKHGETLLNNIKLDDEVKEFSERTGNVSAIERSSAGIRNRLQIVYHQPHKLKKPQHYDDCRDYHRLLVQLEETERRFDEFWRTHQHRLQQCLQLRLFEQDFRELQTNFDIQLQRAAEMTEIGESVARVEELMNETENFQQLCSGVVLRAGEVIASGQQLLGTRGVYPWEIVQPKCDELQRVCEILRERVAKRIETLYKNSELMERVEKANQWCTNGVELLASQRIEKCAVSVEIAEQSLHEIQVFISSASAFKLSSPSQFKKIFLESTTPETKALVSQVLQRIDDVSLMCDKRIASLKTLTLKPPRPVQTVTPEPAVPLQPPGGAPHLLRRKHKTDVVHDLRPRSMDGVADSGVSLSGDACSSPDSSEHLQNRQDCEARRMKRGHVLTELLETERIYVNEMCSILRGYCDKMQSEEMMHIVPPSLQGKEDILFGNLHELYTFHNEIFLKDLENCISTTELVALCFVQRRDTFYRLYSFYCQNIPRSERLRETLVDTHLFLQECQKRLGHKLPLAAYLLKPVQRITKYQLLLKDLLRFSDSGSCTKELQKALDCMLIVLKCVNDSMHQVAITGFPSDLSQQGELLLQDSFQIWTEVKRDIRLRIKPQQRHIFLYQKSMLFCKQASKTGHNKSTYQFKHFVKMSQIGLTESVRGDIKRFEVWLQGRQEVHTFQAPTIEIKNKWVAEIKRVLLNQLEELKGEKIKQYGLNHHGLKQTTSWDSTNILVGTTHRTINYEGSSESSNRNSNCSSSGDDNCLTSVAGSSILSSTDKDVLQDTCGWSSDYSNSEDEISTIEDTSTPGNKFVALADYVATGHSEVSMREGEIVELLKVGCGGWWFVRISGNAEGWTPAAYLELLNRKCSLSSNRNQERMNAPRVNE